MPNHLYYTYGRQGLSTLRDCRLVVVTRLPPSSHLLKTLLSCASTSGISRDRITVIQTTKESHQVVMEEVPSSCTAVVAVGAELTTALAVNEAVRRDGKPFVFCDIFEDEVVIFGDGGASEDEVVGGGFCRADSTEVCIGTVSGGEGGVLVVTCNRSHGLQEGDRVRCVDPGDKSDSRSEDGSSMFTVVSLVSNTDLAVAADNVQQVRPGALLRLVSRPSHSRRNQLSLRQCLESGGGGCRARQAVAVNTDTAVDLMVAGAVMQELVGLVTRRFPPTGNRLARVPVTRLLRPSSLQGRHVLVSGTGLVGQLVVAGLAGMGEGTRVTLLEQEADRVTPDEVDNSQMLTQQHLGESPQSRVLSSLFPGAVSSVPCDLTDRAQCEALWSRLDLVISTGGSFDTRRSLDQICVEHTRPLVDMAVAGLSGQVECIVPHKTCSYSSVSDPPEKEAPYCVLKSFPHIPEHSTVWASEKLKHLLFDKPAAFNKFMEEFGDNVAELEGNIGDGSVPDGAALAYKMLTGLGSGRKPSWRDCVTFARLKFEKYFNHKAKQLLSSFPQDTKLNSGEKFWSWPKLSPHPVEFDQSSSLHVEFVSLLATAMSLSWGVTRQQEEGEVSDLVSKVAVPEFCAKNKTIVTDESVTAEESNDGGNNVTQVLDRLPALVKLSRVRSLSTTHYPEALYTALLVATSQLRCCMYRIAPLPTREDVVKTRDGIQPCGAPTAFQVAGRGLQEACRVLSGQGPCSNWWLGGVSGGRGVSESGGWLTAPAPPPPTIVLSPSLSLTLWDKMEVRGEQDWTLQRFLDEIKEKYQVEVTMVVQDSRMVYVPFMPGHKSRLPKLMSKLLKSSSSAGVNLSITGAVEGEEEDVSLPPVKYFVS